MAALEMIAFGVLELPQHLDHDTNRLAVGRRRAEIIGLLNEDLRDNFKGYAVEPWRPHYKRSVRGQATWNNSNLFRPYYTTHAAGYPSRVYLKIPNDTAIINAYPLDIACRLILDDFNSHHGTI
jgi:hypothetical protein